MGHDHHHSHPNLPVHETEKTFSNAWKNFATDVEWRLGKGLNPHAEPVQHGNHMHAGDPKLVTLDKFGIVAGSVVSLGVAIHGLVNVKRGLTGWKDDQLGEQHDPSLQYTVIGAAETIGGLALTKRLLSGTMKVFRMVQFQPTPMPQTDADAANKREHSKSAAQRAEDMAYTINHALSCTATDFIDPIIGTYTQKYLGKRVDIGCGEDHGHGGHDDAGWQNVVGEFVGDFGAVPVTVALQHYAPWFMDGIRYVAEPLFGDMFRHGAKEAANDKLQQSVLARYPLSKEAYQQHARELYHYEMEHLPQGLVWTGAAIAMNVGIQVHALKSESPWQHILTGKVTGALVSAGGLFGLRSFATEFMKKWDHWATKHVFLPATKHVGKLFGVKEEDVQILLEKQEKLNEVANPFHDAVQPALAMAPSASAAVAEARPAPSHEAPVLQVQGPVPTPERVQAAPVMGVVNN